ncbi:hypothetical protein GGX14DRAFT_401688 [Mycena pura]|uniref:Uncharacterized protein n=1 Tax=Mycena pura TaxID=153505 RepID=A0AAD6V0I3_9AGAR|nr:hypothetical protein GGX14DRAFT_401688 [Mycena pura]
MATIPAMFSNLRERLICHASGGPVSLAELCLSNKFQASTQFDCSASMDVDVSPFAIRVVNARADGCPRLPCDSAKRAHAASVPREWDVDRSFTYIPIRVQAYSPLSPSLHPLSQSSTPAVPAANSAPLPLVRCHLTLPCHASHECRLTPPHHTDVNALALYRFDALFPHLATIAPKEQQAVRVQPIEKCKLEEYFGPHSAGLS